MTTFGVGELSVMNAHAGAFAEYVAVVHIVGSPSLRARKSKSMILHHTLGDHRYDSFSKLFSGISVAQILLDRPLDACKLIDDALTKCLAFSRPIYIDLPADIANQIVEGAGLRQPLNPLYPENGTLYDDGIGENILSLLYSAKRPCFLLDLCAMRAGVGFLPFFLVWQRDITANKRMDPSSK